MKFIVDGEVSMFNLFKDVEKYQGIPPYSSELYGVYQPLLGWKSKLTEAWIQNGSPSANSRIVDILNSRIVPGLQQMDPGTDTLFMGLPLQPGYGKSPYRVYLTSDLGSELLEVIRAKVENFVQSNQGRLPQGKEEWMRVVDINDLMDIDSGSLRQVNDIYRERFLLAYARTGLSEGTSAFIEWKQKNYFEPMQYESQIAAFLLFYAEAQNGYDPDELKKLFTVNVAPSLGEIFRRPDPLSNIDPNDTSGALSPVGLVHMFRQYFFDLGTFLGEPVEHIWLSPGTTIELVEVSTRKIITERSLETFVEATNRSEKDQTLKDEISDAIKDENQKSVKLGVSQNNTVNLYVYQGTVSANFGIESTRKDSRESAHKRNREQNEKLSSEIKQSFKSVFRTVSEVTDTTSRRHVIQNTSDRLINYELRRKMRRIGVQIQDIGTQLCWQVFVDEPGEGLGLANLVHIAEPVDLDPQPNQKETPYPPLRLTKSFEAEVVWTATETVRGPDNEGYVTFSTLPLPLQPDSGYEFEAPPGGFVDLYIKSIGGRDYEESPFAKAGKLIALTGRLVGNGQIKVGVKSTGLRWNRNVNFAVTGELSFALNAQVKQEIDASNAKIRADGLAAKRGEERATKDAFFKTAKERIELASDIKPRPSWDLREEERTIVYRSLIERLMLDSWDMSGEDADNAQLMHVRSEIVRALFDVDSMLYFVAPEWWKQREHHGQFIGKSPGKPLGFGKKTRSHGALGNEVVVNWSDNEVRPDNYYITDKSHPARLGSSLGWLLQLDGDNLRNAFLNAPWVKAVIPIRPGREKAALNWLRSIEGHEQDGWDAPYLGNDDPAFSGKSVGEVLAIIADRLEQQNGDIENVLQADKVFETGFDHLADGFDAGLDANQVFSQWISVLPTDQIVATEYEPTSLFDPGDPP
jgi:hypothetical protein